MSVIEIVTVSEIKGVIWSMIYGVSASVIKGVIIGVNEGSWGM